MVTSTQFLGKLITGNDLYLISKTQLFIVFHGDSNSAKKLTELPSKFS